MKLSEFEYNLPPGLIAQYPCRKREQARLMVVDRRRQSILHSSFAELQQFLPPQTVLLLNNSKVIPARLRGRREKTGGRVEIFLLHQLPDGYSYRAMIRPLKKLQNGDKIIFEGSSVVAEIASPQEKIVRFNRKDLLAQLNGLGHMPLPPYIKRPDEKLDKEYYQTVYAKEEGSLAAPTAGLHFSAAMLEQLQKRGHALLEVTLHINQGTFNPVKTKDIQSHKMHDETFSLTTEVKDAVLKAKIEKKPVAAVGTTSCRVLETFAQTQKLQGSTDIFIYPGYKFQMTDILITNFHLPKSTLLMLVYALGGIDLIKKAYSEAIKEKYRFYSYGDGMLII